MRYKLSDVDVPLTLSVLYSGDLALDCCNLRSEVVKPGLPGERLDVGHLLSWARWEVARRKTSLPCWPPLTSLVLLVAGRQAGWCAHETWGKVEGGWDEVRLELVEVWRRSAHVSWDAESRGAGDGRSGPVGCDGRGRGAGGRRLGWRVGIVIEGGVRLILSLGLGLGVSVAFGRLDRGLWSSFGLLLSRPGG